MKEFRDEEVEIHPKGLIYLPHERLRNRLNEAFGAGFYKFLPVGDPVIGGQEVIWRFRLSFRDGAESEAVGHAKYIKHNEEYSYGDQLETCSSDAFTRCCKGVGIGLQVWNRDYQIKFMQQHGYRYQSTRDHKWYWRRKDRPAPWDEKKSDRQQGPDYERKRDYADDAKDHFSSLNPSRAAQRFDKQLAPVSREEATWEPDDDEQMRRLHELEDIVFHDDAREE